MSDRIKKLEKQLSDGHGKLAKTRQRHAEIGHQLEDARAKLQAEADRQANAIANGAAFDAVKLTELRAQLDMLPAALDICSKAVEQSEAEVIALDLQKDAAEIEECHAEALTLLDPFIAAMEKAVEAAAQAQALSTRINALDPHRIWQADRRFEHVRHLNMVPSDIAGGYHVAANILASLRDIKARLGR